MFCVIDEINIFILLKDDFDLNEILSLKKSPLVSQHTGS